MKRCLLYALPLLFSSCFTKEEPLVLPPGSSEITSFFLGANYEKEMFFDLGSNTFMERSWADWDLRFSCGASDSGVFLNTGKSLVARKVGVFSLDEKIIKDTNKMTDKKSYPELIGLPDGLASHSAFRYWGNYKTTDSYRKSGIYLIQRPGKSGWEAFKRLQIIDANASRFLITVSNIVLLPDTNLIQSADTLVIPKDPTANYTYYSFDKGVILNPEPPKDAWDIVFTRYKTMIALPGSNPSFYGPISGVLSNPHRVEVARDSAVTDFEDITGASLPKFKFSKAQDVINYDWKTYENSGNGGRYNIAPKLSYIIKDTDGSYYKLRFLDFYDKGVKGCPKFEFVRIK